MKKIFAILMVVGLFVFCSCEERPAMRELLAYQEGDFSCEAVLSGERPIKLTISRTRNEMRIRPDEMEYIGEVEFVFEGKNAWLCAGEAKIKLEQIRLQRLHAVYEAFTLDSARAWRITNERLGGIEIYKCTSDDIVLYIDARTQLPLKIINGDEAIDVNMTNSGMNNR